MASIQTCESKFQLSYFLSIFVATYTICYFSAGKAQCLLGSLLGLLGDKWVCVGSIVLKRKQGLSDEQAAACPGTVVDLIPKKLESFAMSLMLKRLSDATDKQTYFCADHDMTVNLKAFCHQHLNSVTNI